MLTVTARFAPYIGGTEIHTAEVARRMVERGHEVTVLTTAAKGLAERERQDGVEVLRVPAWPSGSDLYVAPRIATVIAERRWDLVHCQGYHTAVAPLVMLGARRARLPYVVTFHSGGHSSPVRTALRPLQQSTLGPLLRRADRLIAVSEFERQLFARRLRIPADRISLIPNGVSVAIAPGAPSTPSEPGPLICSVGRLERYKGHHLIIEALPELIRRAPGARVWIVGEGQDEDRLRRLARRLGVQDRVEHRSVPSGDRAAMADLLRSADAVVLLSEYESQGLAAYEALAVGTPVLVLDQSALGELVAKGLAGAVPPGASPRELADIVDRTVRNPPVRPAPILPSDLRRWSEIVEEIEAVYLEVVAVRRSAP